MSAGRKYINRRAANAFRQRILFIVTCLLLGVTAGASGQILSDSIPELRKIDVIEHLGQTIPLDLKFTNDSGQVVELGQYFHHGKPVILVLAYYTCPMLCTLVLNGVADAVRQMSWSPGQEYQILTISINPAETVELAAAKKARYLEATGKKGIDNGWRFFVGAGDQSKALAEAIGFEYYYDEDQKMYNHPAVVTILTEDGVISRYLYGLEYKPLDVRLALLEASKGKIGNTVDRIILYCCRYDPDAKGYVAMASRIMTLGGGVTLILLAIVLGTFWVRERTRHSS